MIKVIAFDLFGTIFDMSNTPREELRAYGDHIRNPVWSPLVLPGSWENLKAYPDAWAGLNYMRELYKVVAFSNAPIDLSKRISDKNHLWWDRYIPLENIKAFKPNPKTYKYLAECMNDYASPEEIIVVSANKFFGDLEGAVAAGMKSKWLSRSHDPANADDTPDLVALNSYLEDL